VEWKIVVGGRKSGEKMVFECSYRSFSRVAAMYADRGQLPGYILTVHFGFHCFRAFIVESLEFRGESPFSEVGGEFPVGSE
jgi:hypothetical protein